MSETSGGLLSLAFILWWLGAWGTHILVCLQDGSWGFLVAGALFFPIAIVHGTGIWFGAF